MQLMQLLHKILKKQLPLVHKSRLNNVLEACSVATRISQLTLTALGRNGSKNIKTRSNIKKMDRLLGNVHLQKEVIDFYKVMNNFLIMKGSYPWIHIDWTCLCSQTKLYGLRASLSMEGRSIVIYEECYFKEKENNHATHKAFLNKLKALLPPCVKPVIVTDAGFRGPWFKHILKIGWDFVGRLRNNNAIQFVESSDWMLSKDLYKDATGTPTFLGEGLLTKTGKVPVHVISYKGKSHSRHKLNQNKKRCESSKSNQYAAAHKEPLLLVTSLKMTGNMATKVVTIYSQRMRIEENIRDTKSSKYGFGLGQSRTRSIERMKVLLLIAAIATFACWLAGLATKTNGRAADYQAHSSKYTKVLSMVYLGREVLKKGIRIGMRELRKMLLLLLEMSAAVQREILHV